MSDGNTGAFTEYELPIPLQVGGLLYYFLIYLHHGHYCSYLDMPALPLANSIGCVNGRSTACVFFVVKRRVGVSPSYVLLTQITMFFVCALCPELERVFRMYPALVAIRRYPLVHVSRNCPYV